MNKRWESTKSFSFATDLSFHLQSIKCTYCWFPFSLILQFILTISHINFENKKLCGKTMTFLWLKVNKNKTISQSNQALRFSLAVESQECLKTTDPFGFTCTFQCKYQYRHGVGGREEENDPWSKFDKATCKRSKRLRRILSSLSNKRELSAQVFSLEAIFFSVLLSSLN